MQIICKVKGIDALKESLGRKAKQVDYAAMVAVNNTAFKAHSATKDEMRKSFVAPTPWVLGGVRVKKATRASLTATVDLDFWGNKQGVSVEKILSAEIFGGDRNKKRHEIALSKSGLLPEGMYIVPGGAAKLDGYGNMSSGQIQQIIAYFHGFGEQGYKANMSDKRKASLARDKKKSGTRGVVYFVLKRSRGKLPPGIYQRVSFGAMGNAVKPVMIFVRKASYKKRLDFYGVAQRVVDMNIQIEFNAALDMALRTDR